MWPITGSGEACGGSASHTRGLRATASKGGQYLGGADGRWPSAALVAAPGVVCTLIVLILEPGKNSVALFIFLPLASIAFVAALVAAIRGPAPG